MKSNKVKHAIISENMKIKHLRKINRIIITFVFLMLLWLLLTFNLDLFSLLLGIIFSFFISLVTFDLFVEKEEKIQKGLLPRFDFFIFYFFVALWEIYLASFSVAYQVITMRINPKTIKIKTNLKSKFAQALLANSITLTPGTAVIDLQKKHLYIHWLTAKTNDSKRAAKIIKGNYESQLRRIFY